MHNVRAPAAMDYDEAFNATLRERYRLLDPAEIQAAERNRKGRLLREDQDCYAVVDAFKNHRSHTDAFRLAMDEIGEFVSPGQSLCVIDLGAGAGNVAAAFCEAWNGTATAKLTYIAVEPHARNRVPAAARASVAGFPVCRKLRRPRYPAG
jgi:hypothetical protein